MAVRCPAIEHPDVPPADPAELDPLLARLTDPAPIEADEAFPLGTLRPDGRVDLCKQGLGAAGVTRLLPVATASPHARHLLLGTNAIGNVGARAIADVLTPGHHVRTLYLGCNRIDAAGAEALADRLTSDDNVRALWLKRNPVGEAGVRALAAMLGRNTTLRTLDLGGNGIGPQGARALADALNGIESLDLGRPPSERSLGAPANVTGDAGATALAAALPGSPLRRLELRHTGITGRGAKSLLASVPADTRLEYVGLGPGVPRKVKRSFAPHLRPATLGHPDLRAIGSLYR